jgi:hypothetical protein
MSPKMNGQDLDLMMPTSPMKESDLALLTGGDIKRPKLKRRFTRLSLSGVKGPSQFKANSLDKKARVTWGNKITNINPDDTITEDI